MKKDKKNKVKISKKKLKDKFSNLPIVAGSDWNWIVSTMKELSMHILELKREIEILKRKN